MARHDAADNVMWFTIGALFGAGIALLYAPASGEETRKKMKKQVNKSKEAIAERGHELMDRGRHLYEKGRKMADEASEMFEQGRKIVGG